MADKLSRPKLVERTRQWLNRTGDFDYDKALKEYEQFGSMVDVARAKYQADAQLQLRDIPLMLQDPIIAACLASMMETAFQPTHDQTLFQVQSRYPKIADDLNGWGREMGMDDFGLLFGNNLGIYGNLPVKMHYNSRMQLERFSPTPNFMSVVPIVISNRTIGFFVDGQFFDYYEYVYGQYLHYRDLGGTRSPMFNLTKTPGDKNDSQILQNEFVVAPSYLSPAVRPWRNVRLIEDVLVLQRMDQSNFLRIVGVNVGDSVTSKNAMKLLGFYRGIFKKARRVPFESSGMASSSFGNEFEVVIPTSAKQGLDIKDIGGQCLRGSTEIKLLDGRDVPIKEMFYAPDAFIGEKLYVCTEEGTIQESTITNLSSLRKNTTFVRVELSNGKSFEVTPDHPCQVLDGSFSEAAQLAAGTALMTFHDSLVGNDADTALTVVSVEPLDVIEDSYDITVASSAHCFFLAAGVAVHNTEIRALRDLDVQYQRLFTALRTSPSIVGFTEETPSSLGEGPTTIWNQNHARTAKTFQFSVIKTIKQIYLLRARSIGYDINESDFNVNVAAASTVEEESKRKAILAGLEVVSQAFTVFNSVGIPYNKDYLAKKLIGEAFSSAPIDVSELFNVEKKENNLASVNSSRSLILSDALPRVKILEDSGMITSAVAQAYHQQVTAMNASGGMITSDAQSLPVPGNTPAPAGLITSAVALPPSFLTSRELSYQEYVSMGPVASGRDVALSTIDNAVVLKEAFLFSSLDRAQKHRNVSVPVKAVALKASQAKMSADKLMGGQISTITRAGVIANRYVFDNDEDLVNYLYLASSGLQSFLVEELYFDHQSSPKA